MAEWMTMFDGGSELGPPGSERQLADVPAGRGVVVVLGEDDRPIILLTAASIRTRLRARLQGPPPGEQASAADRPQRSRGLKLDPIARKVFWKLAFSRFQSDLYFLELARAIWPDNYTSLLAYKPAWFVHVDPDHSHPRFVRTRDLFASAGRYFGPFPDGRSARRFIDALVDAFDLCRDYDCLLRSPNARPCAYGQMGRCLSVCDGRVSMARYRRVVAAAGDFAAGNHQALKRRIRRRMRAAAKSLRFERAGVLKAGLDRLELFEKPQYSQVAPAEEFRYVIVQRGPKASAAGMFLFDRGRIVADEVIDYPVRARQMRRVLAVMSRCAGERVDFGLAEQWRTGLVAHYLFCGQGWRGLMVRWRAEMTAGELAGAIESAAGLLHLRAPRRKSKAAASKPARAGGYNSGRRDEPQDPRRR